MNLAHQSHLAHLLSKHFAALVLCGTSPHPRWRSSTCDTAPQSISRIRPTRTLRPQ